MTRLGVRNLSKPGDMGQLGSLASHEMLGESGGPLPGAAQWLRMSCTPGVHTWPGSDCTHCTQCTHLANYGLLPGVTDLGTAQSGSGTRQDNISHRLRVVTRK